LFIGANATQSDMHIDSGGTHFWLHLLSGTKQWRFFDKDSAVNLYPIDFTQKFAVDVFDPDFNKHPLFARAQMCVPCTLHTNKLLAARKRRAAVCLIV
jgi:hypothetical protein